MDKAKKRSRKAGKKFAEDDVQSAKPFIDPKLQSKALLKKIG
jgi:hypothetical protein